MFKSITPLAILESKLLLDATATEHFGAELAKSASPPLVIYLQGELGAGKTTLVRGFLRALGYVGAVKSPTFTLVEEYSFKAKGGFVYHFDLYRIEDPEALEFMGIREYSQDAAILLIEWPELGENYLPPPDIILRLAHQERMRSLQVLFLTDKGLELQKVLSEAI